MDMIKRKISDAPKDGTSILVRFKVSGEIDKRADGFAGKFAVMRNRGDNGLWGFAAPVGMGDFQTSGLKAGGCCRRKKRRDMKKQENYWGFRAPDTPEFRDLQAGMFAGTEAEWNSLSPGFRREIYRSSLKKVTAVEKMLKVDRQRLARADLKHEQGMKAILARETL